MQNLSQYLVLWYIVGPEEPQTLEFTVSKLYRYGVQNASFAINHPFVSWSFLFLSLFLFRMDPVLGSLPGDESVWNPPACRK